MAPLELIELPEDLLTALEDLSLTIMQTREAVQVVTAAAVLDRMPERASQAKKQYQN